MSSPFTPTISTYSPTLFVEGLYVPETDVSPAIQLIVSDIVYMVFYGSMSTVRNLLRSHQLDVKTARTSIINDFNKIIHNSQFLAAHSLIQTAKIDITDIYVSAGTLYVKSIINVTAKDKTVTKIFKSVSVSLNT